jgi:hypothetical protein
VTRPDDPDDTERCWQKQLLRWQHESDLLRAMARTGNVDLTRLDDCRRLARELALDRAENDANEPNGGW